MNSEQQKLLERITLVPGLLGGKPTIRAQRFPVSDVLELLSTGMSEEDILEQHPALQKEDIYAALLYAKMNSILTGYNQSENGLTRPHNEVMEEFEKKYEQYLK
jgi:uncharacterized protein (DUF433 family)